VARTGRYKTLIFAALLVLAFGLYLLTNIRPDTPIALLWLWMGITGLGIGPSFAVFILVVQNSVPVRELGTGTSSLTLFQQIGGTVGLAITGSVFGSVLLDEVPSQMAAAGVPPEISGGFASGGGSTLNNLSNVGDLGASILSQVPEQFRAQVEPFIGAMVTGIHQAFSIATGATFVVGILTALAAALLVAVVLPAGRMGENPEPEVAETVVHPGAASPEPSAD
jgi:hypothetical protein